ncbi:MAG: hypothetical protein GF401_01320 [Chitinivibrionales bacterium]|nr:hypothetical protein [Chitinivibrionales bacterium]
MLLSIVCSWVVMKLFAEYPTRIFTAAIVGLNISFSLAVLGRLCLPQLKSVASSEYRDAYRKKHTPFFEAFTWLNKRKPDKIVIPYASQVFYYLNSGYTIDRNALDNPSKHRGAYLLDIDYSQTLGKGSGSQAYDYHIEEEFSFLDLVYEGPDARVYKFED